MRLLPNNVDRASKRGVSVTDDEEKKGSAFTSLRASSFFASTTLKCFLTLCTMSFLWLGIMLWERLLRKKLNSHTTSSAVALFNNASNDAFFGSGGTPSTGFESSNSVLRRFLGLLSPWSSPRLADILPPSWPEACNSEWEKRLLQILKNRIVTKYWLADQIRLWNASWSGPRGGFSPQNIKNHHCNLIL